MASQARLTAKEDAKKMFIRCAIRFHASVKQYLKCGTPCLHPSGYERHTTYCDCFKGSNGMTKWRQIAKEESSTVEKEEKILNFFLNSSDSHAIYKCKEHGDACPSYNPLSAKCIFKFLDGGILAENGVVFGQRMLVLFEDAMKQSADDSKKIMAGTSSLAFNKPDPNPTSASSKDSCDDFCYLKSQRAPRRQCLLRMLKSNRVHGYLLLEQEFIQRQNVFKPLDNQCRERRLVQALRETPTSLARVHELFNDEQHAVVIVEGSKREWYIPILSICDKDLICLNALVLVKAGGMFKNIPLAVVSVLQDSIDSKVALYKLGKAPKESFDDIGGLKTQIQEIKESVELPLTHPEYYEEIGITAPKGVILYGEPGTGKTLLAKAVAHSTSATFLRATGSDLVQKSSGEGARLVRELLKMAKEHAHCIVFLDEIDAIGTKRFDTTSRGEQEVQRTLLELLNQLDGFESLWDVKIILATNRIDSLVPALIRPGRIDRKIELPKPDEKTKLKIFNIHTSGMTLVKDVKFEKIMTKEREVPGADCRAICTEAGMSALRAHRKVLCMDAFDRAL